ncbi:MAG: hypothetical protein RBQ91_06820 [Acholeplasma sp.]|nr:hypothetical protein [Acholeplasma sp.]
MTSSKLSKVYISENKERVKALDDINCFISFFIFKKGFSGSAITLFKASQK